LLSDIQNYWTNFAKTGSPNGPLPVPVKWPEYDLSKHQMIKLQTPNNTIEIVRKVFIGCLISFLGFWKNEIL